MLPRRLSHRWLQTAFTVSRKRIRALPVVAVATATATAAVVAMVMVVLVVVVVVVVLAVVALDFQMGQALESEIHRSIAILFNTYVHARIASISRQITNHAVSRTAAALIAR